MIRIEYTFNTPELVDLNKFGVEIWCTKHYGNRVEEQKITLKETFDSAIEAAEFAETRIKQYEQMDAKLK